MAKRPSLKLCVPLVGWQSRGEVHHNHCLKQVVYRRKPISAVTYDACTPEGNIVSGQLIAKSVEEAQKQLHHQGLFVLSLRTHRRNISLIRKLLARMLPYNSRIRFLSRFVRQISALGGRAGLPFITSIQIIADETKHPIYKQAFTKLGQDVALGKPLADAISRQGHLFPPASNPDDRSCRSYREFRRSV